MSKKFLFLFVFSFLIFFNSFLFVNSAYKHNSSWSNVTLDYNGWCSNTSLTIRAYDSVEYANKESIKDNLCWGNQTPIRNHCQEFKVIQGNLKIHDGPLESMPILYEHELNENSSIVYNFKTERDYYVELFVENVDYNDYYHLLNIFTCKKANKKIINQGQVKVVKLYNQSFNYINDLITLDLYDTIFSNKTNISVHPVDFKLAGIDELNNSFHPILIEVTGSNYSKMNLKYNLGFTKKNYSYKLMFYDPDFVSWMPYDNTFEDNISFGGLDIKPGIYAIIRESKNSSHSSNIISNDKTPVYMDVEDNSSSFSVDSKLNVSNNVSINTNLNNQNKKSGFNYIYILIFLVVLVTIAVILFIVFYKPKNSIGSNKQNNLNNPNVKNTNKATNNNTNNNNKLDILNNYTTTFNRAKEYVNKYKSDYSIDGLKMALRNANVPEDIIDKIFLDEYNKLREENNPLNIFEKK